MCITEIEKTNCKTCRKISNVKVGIETEDVYSALSGCRLIQGIPLFCRYCHLTADKVPGLALEMLLITRDHCGKEATVKNLRDTRKQLLKKATTVHCVELVLHRRET